MDETAAGLMRSLSDAVVERILQEDCVIEVSQAFGRYLRDQLPEGVSYVAFGMYRVRRSGPLVQILYPRTYTSSKASKGIAFTFYGDLCELVEHKDRSEALDVAKSVCSDLSNDAWQEQLKEAIEKNKKGASQLQDLARDLNVPGGADGSTAVRTSE